MEQHIKADVAVIGGGPAGVCAALAAAKNSLTVAFITNRPVLGGNSSSEIRVWTRGAVGAGNLFAEEMGVLGELKMRNLYANPDGNPVFWDEILLDAVLQQSNITLLLNTNIHGTVMNGDNVSMVRGEQLGTEKEIIVSAKMFIDCTGDATIGAQAGLPYYVGEKMFTRNEAEDSLTSENVLGSTILYYVKKEDHNVPFIAPKYAYPMEKIKEMIGGGGRIINETQSGSDCWWFEYGGVHNTISDAQDIAIELKRLVLGVWNYIKNSGEFDADRYTLEWIGSVPGKRESRRMITDYLITQQDVLEHHEFADGALYGGWYMDFHPSEGICATEEENCVQIPVNVYQIPLRCLYNSKVKNLLFAGRNIGTTREAFVSTRIMNTCALAGQAAATLANACIRHHAAPAELSGQQIEAVRQQLLMEDMFIPDCSNADALDLARTAHITASSVFDGLAQSDAEHSYSLNKGAFITVPCPVSGDIKLRLHAATDTKLLGTWYAAMLPSRLCPGKNSGSIEVAVPAGGSMVSLPVPQNAQGKFITLILSENMDLFVALAAQRRTGILCGNPDSPHYYDPFVELDTTGFYDAENVINGFSRPYGRPNVWCSAPEQQPWLQLRWDKTQRLHEIRLFFDPELSMEIPSSRTGSWAESHKFARREGMPPQLVKDYTVQALVQCKWNIIATRKNNWRRLAVLRWGEPICADAIKITVQATWGSPSAQLFEVRIY